MLIGRTYVDCKQIYNINELISHIRFLIKINIRLELNQTSIYCLHIINACVFDSLFVNVIVLIPIFYLTVT
jgi:hypothetical protein